MTLINEANNPKALAGVRVMVTRPAPYGAGLQSLLRDAGAECHWQPLQEIQSFEPGDDQYPLAKSYILDLDLYAKVIVVSRSAASALIEWIDYYWPQLPLGICWISIGKGTAEVLASAGIDAISADGENSEALLSLPALEDVTHERILRVGGVGGRTTLADTLKSRGARVDCADLYQRTNIDWTPDQLRLVREQNVIMITSGEALLHLTAQLGGPLTMPIIVPGERVARMARDLHWPQVVTSNSASDGAMLACLIQWRADASC
ncbi:uroporphyrinogen-III synthase [Pokkaliibacter sp. CJK22405]|uniref:uroporphyrinogen-III synthase n=1 Tax=Pokkaliibacter sp. CJK22405 TaxID=3384615 RepID=UPI00398509BB